MGSGVCSSTTSEPVPAGHHPTGGWSGCHWCVVALTRGRWRLVGLKLLSLWTSQVGVVLCRVLVPQVPLRARCSGPPNTTTPTIHSPPGSPNLPRFLVQLSAGEVVSSPPLAPSMRRSPALCTPTSPIPTIGVRTYSNSQTTARRDDSWTLETFRPTNAFGTRTSMPGRRVFLATMGESQAKHGTIGARVAENPTLLCGAGLPSCPPKG